VLQDRTFPTVNPTPIGQRITFRFEQQSVSCLFVISK
jgi:hypothetical protein